MANVNKDTGMSVEARPSADGDYTEFGVEHEGAWFVLAGYPAVKVAERSERAAAEADKAAAAADAEATAAKTEG